MIWICLQEIQVNKCTGVPCIIDGKFERERQDLVVYPVTPGSAFG